MFLLSYILHNLRIYSKQGGSTAAVEPAKAAVPKKTVTYYVAVSSFYFLEKDVGIGLEKTPFYHFVWRRFWKEICTLNNSL